MTTAETRSLCEDMVRRAIARSPAPDVRALTLADVERCVAQAVDQMMQRGVYALEDGSLVLPQASIQ